MSVALPPPQTPQLAPLEQVRGTDQVVAVFQNYQVHVSGDVPLSDEQINKAIAGADTLSNVVRALTSAAYLEGYPAVRVLYALSKNDLYVSLNRGRLSEVHADKPMSQYFNQLEDADPLTAAQLERRRILASIHADRAGVDSQMKMEGDGAGGTVMEARNTGKAEPNALRVEFANPGNRFVGRNFLDLDIIGSSHWGDEVHLLWREGMNGLNNSTTDTRYHEPSIAWNRVTRFGVIGAGIHYTSYDYVFQNLSLHGDLRQAEALWLFPVYADFTHRWTAQLKVDRTDKKNDLEAGGATVQQEVYTSAEVTTSWSQKFHLITDDTGLDASLAVRRGVSGEHQDRTNANLNYLVYRPALSLKQPISASLNLSVAGSGQYTTDILPEQQEYVLGGSGSATAYLPGVAVGDIGYVGRAQAEYTLTLDQWSIELQPRVFGEYGMARFANPLPGISTQAQTVGDVGAELGFKYAKLIEASVSFAKGVEDHNISQDTLDRTKANVFFRVAVKL